LKLVGNDDLQIFPNTPRTLFAGDIMTVLVRAEQGKMPATLAVRGQISGSLMEQNLVIAGSSESRALVPQRWASKEIVRMEQEKEATEDIVAMSKEFGVLSKHTSLLVLESERAYQEHEIERRKVKTERLLAMNTPTVSGGDLDGLGARLASLSPDQIQPGDPEVRIPAPADARSVVLVFPFGDTKIAHYDAELQTWIARFLIDPETADGRYWVRVTIEHADGSLEEMRLPYTVDTSAPSVSLSVLRLRGNRFRIVVEQDGAGAAEPNAVGLDASRVEVLLPWGETRRLYRNNLGRFGRTFRSPTPVGESLELRVVVTDGALNQRVLETNVTVEQR